MIQFNLLPDVKLEYIKARRTKHLVMLISVVVTAVSVGLIVLLFVGVNIIQRGHLNNLNDDIKAKTSQLEGEPDIDKILTVQNQLNSLHGLHDAKPASDRVGTYMSQVTPNQVSIAQLNVDFTLGTISVGGSAKDVKSVNEFIDTMKFTKFDADGAEKNAFTNVVLTSFDRSENQENGNAATYQITLGFDPLIFNVTKNIKLKVPNQVTTRSVTEKPRPLFEPTEGGQ